MRPVALVLLALLLAPRAEATTIAPLSVAQMTDASTYIVEGRVRRTWSEVDADGVVWTRAEVAVSRVIKGPDEPATLIVDALGGRTDEAAALVPGMPRFSVDEDVILFLDPIAGGTRLTTVAAVAGKYTVRRPPHEDRTIAVRYEVNPEVRYDARFLPVPPRDEWLFVDDLLGEVDRRLVSGWDGTPIPGMTPEELRIANLPERRIR